MKEKYNFKIDLANNNVSLDISPSVFPRPIVLHAAYHFIEDGKVIIEEGDKSIIVILIPNGKKEESALEELAYEFNIQLISSFVEDEESRKHVGIREAMFKAALSSPQRPPLPKPPQESLPSKPPPSESPPENPPLSKNYPKEGD